MNAGPNTPREIKRMASKAKTDASARSVLFEDWLQSGESWKQSKLLARLRNRSSSSRHGMRKWLFYSEMVSRFGSEVAAAIKETKEGDPERSLTEIRKWPECEAGFKLHCPNIPQKVGNHIIRRLRTNSAGIPLRLLGFQLLGFYCLTPNKP